MGADEELVDIGYMTQMMGADLADARNLDTFVSSTNQVIGAILRQ